MTPSRVTEQQDKEAQFGALDLNEWNDSGAEDKLHTGKMEPIRRQSSILEELGRQVSVLWHEDEGHTEAEGVTSEDEDEFLAHSHREAN